MADLQPMSEEEYADLGGYEYLAECRVPPQYQLLMNAECAREHVLNQNNEPAPCGCEVIRGRKCTTNDCPNRRRQIACPRSCGPMCHNNPWENRHLFVMTAKTRGVNIPNKGIGVVATQQINRYELINEYTGNVVRSLNYLSRRGLDYTFSLPIALTIDGYRQGSSARLINHSCKPNLIALFYCHNGLIKVILRATKNIAPGEELTINYGWKFKSRDLAPPCYCGSKNCKGYIGFIRKKMTPVYLSSDDEAPPKAVKTIAQKKSAEVGAKQANPSGEEEENVPLFPTIDLAGADVQRTLSLRPRGNSVIPNFRENHIFEALQPVYIIVPGGSNLVCVLGRIIGSEQNEHCINYYSVLINPGQSVRYVPRWLCFHYQADATACINSHLSQEDRTRIFAHNFGRRRAANALRTHLAVDYRAMVMAGTLPRSRLVESAMPGAFAIGMSPRVRVSNAAGPSRRDATPAALEPSDDEDDAETDPSETEHVSMQVTPKKSQRQVAAKAVRVPRAIFASTSTAVAPTEQVENESHESDEDDEEESDAPEQQNFAPQLAGYISTHRRHLENVRNDFHANTMFRRIFNTACDEVTFLAMSRLQAGLNLTYDDVYEQVREELHWNYYEAVPNQRQYLSYTHYRFATEAMAPGSINLQWCSLCRRRHTFPNQTEQRNHFNRRHAMCAKSYRCGGCQDVFRLPSEFRAHADVCAPDLPAQLERNVQNFIRDAYSDFVHNKETNNKPAYSIRPGVPNPTNWDNPGPSHKKGAEQKSVPLIEMDGQALRPVNQNIRMRPARFEIQKQYTQIASWTAVGDRDPPVVDDGEEPGPSRDITRRPRSKKRSRGDQRREERAEADDDQETGRVTRSRQCSKASSRAKSKPQHGRSKSRRRETSSSESEAESIFENLSDDDC